MLIFARRFFVFFLVPRGFRHFRREEENKRRSIFSEGDRKIEMGARNVSRDICNFVRRWLIVSRITARRPTQ